MKYLYTLLAKQISDELALYDATLINAAYMTCSHINGKFHWYLDVEIPSLGIIIPVVYSIEQDKVNTFIKRNMWHGVDNIGSSDYEFSLLATHDCPDTVIMSIHNVFIKTHKSVSVFK